MANMPEREMSKEDWLMLYHLHRLMEQVVLHGAAYVQARLREAREARHA